MQVTCRTFRAALLAVTSLPFVGLTTVPALAQSKEETANFLKRMYQSTPACWGAETIWPEASIDFSDDYCLMTERRKEKLYVAHWPAGEGATTHKLALSEINLATITSGTDEICGITFGAVRVECYAADCLTFNNERKSSSYRLDVKDLDSAKRAANALKHLAQLCGARAKEDPF